MPHARDTIAAIATAPGAGGVGVIRIAGPAVPSIAKQLLGRMPRPRHAHYARFLDADGSTIDHGIVLHFPAPHSYTGEPVLELQAHGSPPLLAALLRRTYALGARPARPGEFTERAYLNDKLDLAQAEAVADLIGAGSEAAARAALRSLDGAFSSAVDDLLRTLIALRVQVEAAIDFPEEEIDFLGDGQIDALLSALRAQHADLLGAARRGQRLRDGLHVVLVGPPNAGKSSLLNALAGAERAIVTEIAGTTRDLLRETVQLDGIELILVDTAGLREHAGDAIEREGMRRARAERERADLLLAVVAEGDVDGEAALRVELGLDPSRDANRIGTRERQEPQPQPQHPPASAPTATDPKREGVSPAGTAFPGPGSRVPGPGSSILWLHNKIDLSHATPRSEQRDGHTHLWLSAASGAGLDRLVETLRERAGLGGEAAGAFSARARHVAALEQVGGRLAAGAEQLARRAGELLAEELRLAQDELAAITGAFDSDALLGEIFGSFCIGK